MNTGNDSLRDRHYPDEAGLLAIRRRSLRRRSAVRAAFYIGLSAITIVWLVPVVLIISTALKSNPELYANGLFTMPKHIMWKNFLDAWKVGKMSLYMKNSVFVVAMKVPLHVLIATLGAFALTKMNFRFARGGLMVVLFAMLLPIHVALIPLTILLSRVGLIDTHAGLVIVYLGFSVPFGIFLARGYFRTIPAELDDAAMIDGCSDVRRYWSIVMPIATPIIGTLIILDFLDTWNELLQALLFLRSDAKRTLMIGLLAYRDRYYSDYTLMNAGVLIAAAPVTVIYVIFQRYFISGLSAGALKG